MKDCRAFSSTAEHFQTFRKLRTNQRDAEIIPNIASTRITILNGRVIVLRRNPIENRAISSYSGQKSGTRISLSFFTIIFTFFLSYINK